jgi:hypothetical protein
MAAACKRGMDSSRQSDSRKPASPAPPAGDHARGDSDFVRGPGRERNLPSMRSESTERFVVAPHRHAWGSGIWSVRRDGVLLAVHKSRWEAMVDATERAFNEWAERGERALVQVEEMDGRLVEARVFGPQRADPRTGAVVLSQPPESPRRH